MKKIAFKKGFLIGKTSSLLGSPKDDVAEHTPDKVAAPAPEPPKTQ